MFRMVSVLVVVAGIASLFGAAGQVQADVIFEDDFNRPDGPVGNGWIDSPDNPVGNLGIVNEKLSTPVNPTSAGIHRPRPFSGPLTIQATIWETDGNDLVGGRFESVFVVGNDGTLAAHDGYGITVRRTEADTNNSQVELVDNGNLSPRVQIFSDWQFNSVLEVEFLVFPDGRIEGSITEGNNVFEFAFGPREIQSSGANFGFYHGWNAPGSEMPPRMDDLVIFSCDADCNENGVCDFREMEAQIELFVPNRDSDSVARFDGVTAYSLGYFAPPGGDTGYPLDYANHVVFGPNGHIYVSSALTNRILEFHGVTGEFLRALSGVQTPVGIEFLDDTTLLAASFTNDSIVAIDLTDGSSSTFVDSGQGGLNGPADMVLTPWGTLLVGSQASNNKVYEFDLTGDTIGVFIETAQLGGAPGGLLFDDDETLLVANLSQDEVQRYARDTDGSALFIEDFIPSGSGGLDQAEGLAWGPSPARNLFVSSRGTDSVLEFSRVDGAPVDHDPDTPGVQAAFVSGDLLSAPTYITFRPTPLDRDCNGNGVLDACDIADGTSEDADGNGIPDECECVSPAFAAGVPGVSIDAGVFDGYIDPRAESDDGVNVNLGLDAITIKFTTPMENDDASPLTADRFSITDTANDPPAIIGINTEDGETVTIEFDGIISVQAWTTIGVDNVRSVCGHMPFAGTIDVGFLPCDVDQSGTVSPFDLLRFRQYVNGSETPEAGVLEDYIDMNREGVVSPFDLLVFRQLINGASPPATQPWAGQGLPPQP